MSYSSLEIHDADCQGDHILHDEKLYHLLPSNAKIKFCIFPSKIMITCQKAILVLKS